MKLDEVTTSVITDAELTVSGTKKEVRPLSR